MSATILFGINLSVDSYVKDSTDFVQRIGQISLGESDIKVSFDVVSLFTRVPEDEALQVISETYSAGQDTDE